jgi:hypothetical protein
MALPMNDENVKIEVEIIYEDEPKDEPKDEQLLQHQRQLG